MKYITITDRLTGKVIKREPIPDSVAKIIKDVGGLNLASYFDLEVKDK